MKSTPMIHRPLCAVLFPLVVTACGGESPADPGPGPAAPAAVVVPDSVFVASPPAGAIGVHDAVSSAKAGDQIVVRGVIGGRKKPFVDGRAVLVAAEAELKPCPDEEGCPTPWDFCCETSDFLLENTLAIQVVGADGAPLATSLEGVHGLEPLTTIVVAGKVRNAEGSLLIDAAQIHVEPH